MKPLDLQGLQLKLNSGNFKKKMPNFKRKSKVTALNVYIKPVMILNTIFTA